MMQEICLHLLDIVQNSLEAGATRIEIRVREHRQWLEVVIRDNGRGMPVEMAERAFDPFVTGRTTRKVGLGLPLVKQAAELTGGFVKVESEPGRGTEVRMNFNTASVDCMPFGDMGSTIRVIIACNPNVDLEYVHEVDGKRFSLSTPQMRQVLQEVPLNHPMVLKWIKEYVDDGLAEIRGGVGSEDSGRSEAG
ncbi:MAG: ATP-binding protein [Bacillota bacterium]